MLRLQFDMFHVSQVMMKLIKHCHEVTSTTGDSGVAQGALLGLVSDSRYVLLLFITTSQTHIEMSKNLANT